MGCGAGSPPERLFELEARLDVLTQPRLERVDRLVRFARTLGALLELPGELQRFADELPAIDPKKGIECGEGSALVPIEKSPRLRDARSQ